MHVFEFNVNTPVRPSMFKMQEKHNEIIEDNNEVMLGLWFIKLATSLWGNAIVIFREKGSVS